MKTCTGCGETKPLAAFWRSSKMQFGRHSRCKECQYAADTRGAERTRRYRGGVSREERSDNRKADRMADAQWGWQDQGACRGKPTAWWFPSDVGAGVTEETAEALRLCREECPVRAECLDFALSTHQDHGVWGGESPGARRRMKRRRKTA